MALAAAARAFSACEAVIASTYQAVSGSGAQGIVELEEQIKAITAGVPFTLKVYPRQIAFNVIPQVDAFTDNGYTKEEMKMLNEGRKIMGLPELRVSCTCVRVPVYRSHSVSITAQFERPVDADAARAAYAGKAGVQVVDDIANRVFPVPLDTTGKDDCLVGRIRKNLVFDNALDLWVVGDQVRKGAALNAVQIAEILEEIEIGDRESTPSPISVSPIYNPISNHGLEELPRHPRRGSGCGAGRFLPKAKATPGDDPCGDALQRFRRRETPAPGAVPGGGGGVRR